MKNDEMLNDIRRMLIVLEALTPENTQGYIVLKKWKEKYIVAGEKKR